MTYETLLVETHGAVTLVRLNRPEVLNALNRKICSDLRAAFTTYDADSAQRCLVLTGSDKVFAAGADIKEMENKTFPDMFRDNFFEDIEQLRFVRKPWIAAVAGYALGGGCELAMTADYILAADTAKFGQPEVRLGVIPGLGGTQRLPRAIGKAKAMQMCLTGRMMDASEAERAGLVAQVVPAASLLEEAMKQAQAIAEMPPLAVLANKEAVNESFESGLTSSLQFERRLFNGMFSTADKMEGMAAFVEKRKGKWRNA